MALDFEGILVNKSSQFQKFLLINLISAKLTNFGRLFLKESPLFHTFKPYNTLKS